MKLGVTEVRYSDLNTKITLHQRPLCCRSSAVVSMPPGAEGLSKPRGQGHPTSASMGRFKDSTSSEDSPSGALVARRIEASSVSFLPDESAVATGALGRTVTPCCAVLPGAPSWSLVPSVPLQAGARQAQPEAVGTGQAELRDWTLGGGGRLLKDTEPGRLLRARHE